MKKVFFSLIILALGALAYGFMVFYPGARPVILPTPKSDPGLSFLTLPEGASISLWAEGLDRPRDLAWGPDGALLVSDLAAGTVLGLRDKDGDGKAESKDVLIAGLNRPHGIAYACTDTCFYLVAEEHRVAEYDETGAYVRTLLDLPTDGRHTTRSILFPQMAEDPDEFYVSIGSSCNTCYEDDERRAAVLKSSRKTPGEYTIFSKGLRNAVFMTLHPIDGRPWVTEMGRDYLGDDLPPDELNVLEEGKDFGWPICYGQNIHDGDFDKNTYIMDPCTFKVPARVDLPAHGSPLGLGFVPEEGWPEDWWHDALVSLHGSWNRSEPFGYKIVRVDLTQEGQFIALHDFVTGWLSPDAASALGRPVDLLIQPGGTIFISDDKAGVIYRFTLHGESPSKPKEALIRVDEPQGSVGTSFTIRGEARGYWYFEASFPASLETADGTVLTMFPIQAEGEWMTEDFVPFNHTVDLTPYLNDIDRDFVLVLHKDNPSGLPENDQEVRIPLTLSVE